MIKQNFCQEILETIKRQSYVPVAFSMPKKELEQAAKDFTDFLTLPQETKERFSFLIDANNRQTDVGYKKKSPKQGDLDEKEYFHYNEYAEQEFKELLKTKDPKIINFFKSTRKVYAESKKTLSDIMKSLETEFPGIYEKFFPKSKLPNFYLRFLQYRVIEGEQLLAKGHYDRGACTLALAESAPGLRLGWTSKDLQPAEHKEGQAFFMPAYNMHSVTSPLFKPVWHDVIQKPEHSLTRWAIVFFAEYEGMPAATSEEVHAPKA